MDYKEKRSTNCAVLLIIRHKNHLLWVLMNMNFELELLTLEGFLKRGARYSAPVTQEENQSFIVPSNTSPSVGLISSPSSSSMCVVWGGVGQKLCGCRE